MSRRPFSTSISSMFLSTLLMRFCCASEVSYIRATVTTDRISHREIKPASRVYHRFSLALIDLPFFFFITLFSFFKNISDTSYGMDQLFFVAVIDFFAEITDINIDYIGAALVIVVPHAAFYFISGHNRTRISY